MKTTSLKHTSALAALIVLCLVGFGFKACAGISKLDRAIFAVDSVPALLTTLNLPQAESACANELITGVSNALHDLKTNPSSEQWNAVKNAVARFDSSACIHNARLAAIAKTLQNIVAAIPTPKPSTTGRANPPDFNKVNEADLKELERLTKR